MNKRCKHVEQNGFNCGSYAFNLYKDDIDQVDLCDVHYWQEKAQRTWVGLTDEEIEAIWYAFHDREMGYAIRFAKAIEAKLKDKNEH
jgi:hypothetical protein